MVFLQETHARGARVDELLRGARRDGWLGCLNAAAASDRSEVGSVGGVGIFVRKGLLLTDAEGVDPSVGSPPDHRCILRLVNAVVPGGLLVGCVYLHTSIGFVGQNLDILNRLGERLRALDRPFVLGGDFNFARTYLHDSGWLHAMRASVVGPPEEQATCITAAGSSSIDYFVVSNGLRDGVLKTYIDDRPTEVCTHRPVVMRLAAADRGRLVQQRRRPQRLDPAPLKGPNPQPMDYAAVTNLVDEMGSEASQEQLDEAMREWGARAEVDILGAHDARGDPAHAGLFGPPRLVWALATPTQSCGPRVGGEAAQWRHIADRLRELRHLRAALAADCSDLAWRGGRRQRSGRQAQVRGLMRRLRGLRWSFSSSPPPLWVWWVEWRKHLGNASDIRLHILTQVFATEADKHARRASAACARSWRLWASETAMQHGARLAHRWTKPVPPWAEPARDADGRVLGPQAQAEATASTWHKLWRADEEAPPLDLTSAIAAEAVPEPTIDQFRQTCRLFSSFTAVGTDEVHPRHLAELADEAAGVLIRLMVVAINMGRCPLCTRAHHHRALT